MDADTFAEWCRRQGYKITRTRSSYWYNAGPGVLQAFPYHWLIQPDRGEINRLLADRKSIAVRFSTPLTARQGIVSYHVTLKGPYSLKNLRSQARNGVRRGLENAQVEPISFQRLATEGWALQYDTMERQGRTGSMNQAAWENLCLAADGLPGFQAWGAIVEGTLAASLITTRIDDTYYVPYAQSLRQYLNRHVNNGLFFTACCHMLDQDGVNGIFFCLHSLDARATVDQFKFRMNFTPTPVRQRVVFHPLLEPFSNRLTHRLVQTLHNRAQDSYALSKAEGMLRFNVQGKLPADRQDWPDCLLESRPALLARMTWDREVGRQEEFQRNITEV